MFCYSRRMGSVGLVARRCAVIRHLAGVYEVVEDIEATVAFYRDVIGTAVEFEPGGVYAHANLPGVLHFGVWERGAAAEAVFGAGAAAERVSLGFHLGFEVANLAVATARLRSNGATVDAGPVTAPSGQMVSRVVLPSGSLADLLETPWAREMTRDEHAWTPDVGRSRGGQPSV